MSDKTPILGGWNLWVANIPEGAAAIRFKTQDFQVGDRVRFTAEFEVTLDPDSGEFVNQLVQNILDGHTAGYADFCGDSLIRFEAPAPSSSGGREE